MSRGDCLTVAGAGITGLAAAHALGELGYEVRALERDRELARGSFDALIAPSLRMRAFTSSILFKSSARRDRCRGAQGALAVAARPR